MDELKLLEGWYRIGTVHDWSGCAEDCGDAIVGMDKTIPKNGTTFICNLRVPECKEKAGQRHVSTSTTSTLHSQYKTLNQTTFTITKK